MKSTIDQINFILESILIKLDNLLGNIPTEPRTFLSIDEASEYLSISKNTLYKYVAQGVLPFLKPRGRKLYFKISDLDDFVLNDSQNNPQRGK